MKSLPRFHKRPHDRVHQFASRALTNKQVAPTTFLKSLQIMPDRHYRAIFDPAYFVLQEGEDEPTKSQWNTLKKRMKRMDFQVFIFKEYGLCPCHKKQPGGPQCYYIDFGFLPDER